MEIEFEIENTTLNFVLPESAAEKMKVKSEPYDYEVDFVTKDQLVKSLGDLSGHNKEKNFIYVDGVVDKIYGEELYPGADKLLLKAVETNKNLTTAMKLVDKLQEQNYTKKEKLISVGGGITEDLSAFARAVFKRGINWVYVPTTLLSMADSCIGAKSCLNYKGAKNQLGLFSAPSQIYICEDVLTSLHRRDVLSGYGEIIKLVIVGGNNAIAQFDEYTNGQNGDILKNIIPILRLSLSVKRAVIEVDEFENDIRKALNYGHTIGHAIEPLVKYKIPHGIAISIGMIIENDIAVKYGKLPQADADRMQKMIMPFIDKQSLTYLKRVNIDDIINNMKKDKKNMSNEIVLAVPEKIGNFGLLKVSVNQLSEFLTGAFDNITK